jgi:hypothetical protein
MGAEIDDRMRLNNWSIAASYDTAHIFAGLGFGSSTASRSIISLLLDHFVGAGVKSRHAVNGHVRFTSESGHVQCTSSCLLWANSGHRLIRRFTLREDFLVHSIVGDAPAAIDGGGEKYLGVEWNFFRFLCHGRRALPAPHTLRTER